MKKSWLVTVMCAFVLPAAAAGAADAPTAAVAAKGQPVVTTNGTRLGIVSRVGPDGSPQVIIDGRMITIPANTLSNADGKLTTSLSKSAVLALH